MDPGKLQASDRSPGFCEVNVHYSTTTVVPPPNGRFCRRIAAMLAVAITLASGGVAAQEDGLFKPIRPASADPTDDESAEVPRSTARVPTRGGATVRHRRVRLDFARLADVIAAIEAGQTASLDLNLFDDVRLKAVDLSVAPTSSGGYSLSGRLEGVLFGTAVLVVNGDIVAGSIRSASGTYTFDADGGVCHIRKVDPSTLPPLGEPLRPPQSMLSPFKAPRAAEKSSVAEDEAFIDVVVLYTPAVRDAVGGLFAARSLAELMVAETNQAYADSGVDHQVFLTRIVETDYVEAGASLIDLSRLARPDDGYMDEAHELREKTGADLVHLVATSRDVCGIAYLMLNPSPAFQTGGFGLTNYECGGDTFAHELGHNMGLRHDRYVDAANTPSPYSHGYVNQRAFEEEAPTSSRWRTIMAYRNQCQDAGFTCSRLLRFSNPDLTYEGDPMGISGGFRSFAIDGPADARRTLNETRDIVASFRAAGPDLIVAMTPPLQGRGWSPGQTGIILTIAGSNQGRIESAATVGSVYRSTDPRIGTDDTLLESFDIEAREGKETFSHAFVETAPDEIGIYYYGVCVDAVENETDGDNNCTPGLGVTVGPTVSVTDSRTVEGLDLTFSFSLSEAQSTDVTVQWELARETAVDGLDYVDQSGTVTIPANQTLGVATVETVDDEIPEGDDTLTLTVVESTGVVASFEGRQAIGTIVDNDGDLPGIRDERLRDAVYEALAKNPEDDLTFADLASLTGLNASGRGIESLDGLEAATALTNLSLDNNSIEDLSPLAHLANLNRLQIARNGIEDVSQLASLVSLTNLGLDGNSIRDLSPLKGLSGLTTLSLNRTGISDLSALQDLVALETLNADSNKITSIDGLENLTRLATANLNFNAIADLTPLSGLRQLSYLGLWDNSIDDVTPLANLTRLTWLDLDRNRIASIAPLSGLSALTELHLFGNEIADLPDLSALGELQILGLSSNRITDIGPIGALSRLRGLYLSQNSVADITPLSNLTRLSFLYLDGNLISDISPLSGLNRLDFLSARDNRIVDLTPLAGKPRLFVLILDRNAIRDVAPLAEVRSLIVLDLGNNQIRDIKPLVDNAGLGFGDRVYLHGNPLDDASVSDHVPALLGRGIDLYHIGISVAEASAREGGDLDFVVRLSVPSSEDVVANWVARPGSATEGDDYAGGQSGSVTIPTQELEATFALTTNEDEEDENHETVRVSLSAPAAGFGSGVLVSDSTAWGLIADPNGPVANVPVFAHANHDTRQGFVRVINRRGFNVVHIEAVDPAGNRHPTTLAMDAGRTVHFNSNDLESGNIAKGLSRGVGQGSADWRLELSGNDVEVLTYMRTNDGFLTSLHDLVPAGSGGHPVPIFNPGRNTNQESLLRLINGGDVDAEVTISGVDDRGMSSEEASLTLAAGETRTISAADMEKGTDLVGALGTGSGKWRLLVASDQPIVVASLMQTPTGHLTNLSTTPDNTESAANGSSHHVYLFPSASDANRRQGFARVVNRGGAGSVEIRAYDETDNEYETVVLQMDAGETVHFNSDDLETGNAAKGLSGSTGAGEGDWRLVLTSALELAVLAYMRTEDGFLTSMHDTVPENAGVHRVPIFNPASNRNQVSQLRLINAGDELAQVTISGVDDTGRHAAGRVRLSVPAGKVRTVTAQALEDGAEDLDGALGDGFGKWSLGVNSDTPIYVLNLLASPTGHLTNLSTRPAVESAQSENTQ